ncbi:hypothetical protein GCM10011325_41010 [Dyadobacter sediminis]|nr:hypothetical protein GCM10011325_41010 [Dyadobacter sediminis]
MIETAYVEISESGTGLSFIPGYGHSQAKKIMLINPSINPSNPAFLAVSTILFILKI